VKWLLDTNVVSETVRPKANRDVVSWVARQPRDDIAISVVTLAEIHEGIESSANETRRRELTDWLESILVLLRENTLPVDDAVLIDWLRLSRRLARRQIARQAPDLLLASTARVHKLTIVSRNVRDFANTGITVYNPWIDETQKMEAP
jgi:toxin FitB